MSENQQPQPTHYALPVAVFQAAVKVLSGLPYSQVAELLNAMSSPIGVSVPPTEQDPPNGDQ